VTAFATSVENWYDSQMARVSGSYKRWIKRWIIAIAAVLVNQIVVNYLPAIPGWVATRHLMKRDYL